MRNIIFGLGRGVFYVKSFVETDPVVHCPQNVARSLTNADFSKILRKQLMHKLSFVGSFSHFTANLSHELIQMTTDSESSIDFLQK